MLENSFNAARTHLAYQAVQAIERNEHQTLHAIGEILPVLSQARDSVLKTLQDAGFGDVEPPATLEQSTSQPEQFVGLVQHLHQGFADAQQVLFGQIMESIQHQDQPQVERNLDHILHIASAWDTVEEAFAKPDIKEAMKYVVAQQPPTRRDQRQESVWERLGDMLLTPAKTPEKAGELETKLETKQVTRDTIWVDLAKELKRFQGRSSNDVLRQMRLDQNLTQGEVAKEAGNKSVSYVSAIERGQIKPSLGAAMEILAATRNDPHQSILSFVWLVKVYEETVYKKSH